MKTTENLFKEILNTTVDIFQDKDEDMSDYMQLNFEYKYHSLDGFKYTALIFNFSHVQEVVKELINQVFLLKISEEEKHNLIKMILDYNHREIHSQTHMIWTINY